MTVLFMNGHLTEGTPNETLFLTCDSWFTTDPDTKPYIFKLLDNMKVSRIQCITTSMINYGPHIDNTFAHENFVYAFCRQLARVITLKPTHTSYLLPTHDQIQAATTLLI